MATVTRKSSSRKPTAWRLPVLAVPLLEDMAKVPTVWARPSQISVGETTPALFTYEARSILSAWRNILGTDGDDDSVAEGMSTIAGGAFTHNIVAPASKQVPFFGLKHTIGSNIALNTGVPLTMTITYKNRRGVAIVHTTKFTLKVQTGELFTFAPKYSSDFTTPLAAILGGANLVDSVPTYNVQAITVAGSGANGLSVKSELLCPRLEEVIALFKSPIDDIMTYNSLRSSIASLSAKVSARAPRAVKPVTKKKDEMDEIMDVQLEGDVDGRKNFIAVEDADIMLPDELLSI